MNPGVEYRIIYHTGHGLLLVVSYREIHTAPCKSITSSTCAAGGGTLVRRNNMGHPFCFRRCVSCSLAYYLFEYIRPVRASSLLTALPMGEKSPGPIHLLNFRTTISPLNVTLCTLKTLHVSARPSLWLLFPLHMSSHSCRK